MRDFLYGLFESLKNLFKLIYLVTQDEKLVSISEILWSFHVEGDHVIVKFMIRAARAAIFNIYIITTKYKNKLFKKNIFKNTS